MNKPKPSPKPLEKNRVGTISNAINLIESKNKKSITNNSVHSISDTMQIKDITLINNMRSQNRHNQSQNTHLKPPVPPKPKYIPVPKYTTNFSTQPSIRLESLKSLHAKLERKNCIEHYSSNIQNNDLNHVTCIRVENESQSIIIDSNIRVDTGTKSVIDIVVEDHSETTINGKNSFQLHRENAIKCKNNMLDVSDDASSSLMEKTLEGCCFEDGSLRDSGTSSSLSDSDSDGFIQCYNDYDLSSQCSSNNPSISPSDSHQGVESTPTCDTNQLESPKTQKSTRQRKAFLVAEEIMTSERTFVSILKLLNVDFRSFLYEKGCVKSNDKARNPDGLPERDLTELLKFIPNLQSLNEGILTDFQSRILNWKENPKIADIIVKKGPFLKLYTNYIKELESQTNFLHELANRYTFFGTCLKEFQFTEVCGKIPISTHMLTPMQRITKYKELMKQYLKYLQDDDIDYDDAQHALNIVKDVAEHANEAIRQLETSARLLCLQDRLNGNVYTNGEPSSISSSGNIVHVLVEPGRSLVKEGQLMKLCRRGARVVYLILLSDSLLYTTEELHGGKYCPLKLRYKMPLEGMRVDVPVSDDFQNEFSVISTSRSFTVKTSCARERDEWIAALRSAIEANANRRWSFQTAKTADFEDISVHALGKQAPAWIPDDRVTMCQVCTTEFTFTFRRHHCRACGKVVCRHCSDNRAPLSYLNNQSVRVCDHCFEKLEKAVEKMDGEDEENAPDDVKGGKRKSIKEVKSKFRKGLNRDHTRTRSRKPERLLEVCGGDVESQMCGYLRHYSRRTWRQCWFVLKDKVLYEYRAPEDVCALTSLPVLGYSVNSDFESLDIFYDGMDSSNAFQLLHPNQLPLVFYAESIDLAQKWRKTMEAAVVL